MFLRIFFARGMNLPSISVYFPFDKISYIKILWTKDKLFDYTDDERQIKENSMGIQCYVKSELLSKICLNKFMLRLFLYCLSSPLSTHF